MEMNEFCRLKGIKREFSPARTLQQNGVAERKNRTLIEVARTMQADSLQPTDIQEKDEKSSQIDKSKHGNGKSVKRQSQSQKSTKKSTPTKSKPRSHQVKENTTLETKFAKS
ncbi:putative ribonuclease H-like domain-containing protein [Tanacetum coccineum]